MNFLIIGATRGIGKQLLNQGIGGKHRVTILARNPASIDLSSEQLRVVPGDVLDLQSVQSAVEGQHAVSLTIGQGPTRKPVTLFSRGTQNVITAMERHGVNNLICVTGIGAGDSKGHGGFIYDRIVNPLLLKTIYDDKNVQEALVRGSNLEWVIVRPGMLTNGSLTGTYRILTDLEGVKAGKISRADVAHFILAQLNSMSYAGQTPLLTY